MLTAYDITGEAFHHTREDVDTLHKLANRLHPGAVIVNIGTCFGTSALALVEEHPHTCNLFTIDIKPCPEAVEAWRSANVPKGQIIFILGNSQDVGEDWPIECGLVFIDGAHDRASLEADIAAWSRHLAPDGILAFHDYGTPSLPQVKAVVDEQMADWWQILSVGTIRAFHE